MGWKLVQWNIDLRKPDLRKNLDLRKIVGTTDFLALKLFDLKSKFYKKRGPTFFYDITRKLGLLDFTQYRSKSSSF